MKSEFHIKFKEWMDKSKKETYGKILLPMKKVKKTMNLSKNLSK